MSYILNVLKKLESEKKRHDKSIDLKDTLLHDEFISNPTMKKHKFSPAFVAAMASLLTMIVLSVTLIIYFFYTTDNTALPSQHAAQSKKGAPSTPPVKPVEHQKSELARTDRTRKAGIKKSELISKDNKKSGLTLASVRATEIKEKPQIKKSQDTVAITKIKKQKTIPQKEKIKADQSQKTEPKKTESKQSVQDIQEQLPLKWRWEPVNNDSKKSSDNIIAEKKATPSKKPEETKYSLSPLSSINSNVSAFEDNNTVDNEDLGDTKKSATLINNWKNSTSDTIKPKAEDEPKDNFDSEDPTVDSEPIPSLRIRGAIFISDGSRANYVVLDYNGQSHKLKEGESADELTLVKIYSNKALLRFKNRAFYKHF